MKKIINGSRYDTDKAECIATASSGHYTTDFAYWEESIYRTPRGRWFVAGEGGPMSRYSRSRGNETSGSEDIKPLDDKQAQEWLEHYGKPEQVEQYFAAAISDA
jgi:hypothetical protein